ncbi:MAG: hypothetical protein RL721_1891 [Candidatus Eisenbacteria bacterium]
MPGTVRNGTTMTTRTARPLAGARRCACIMLLALATVLSPGTAGAVRWDVPPPWRAGGPVGFTLDAASFPDSTGYHLEVYVRVPPATIHQLARDERGAARLRLTVTLRGRQGAPLSSAQELVLGPEDTADAEGQVAVVRFPVVPGRARLTARLEDLQSEKHRLMGSRRERVESLEMQGDVEAPRAQGGRDLSDVEFVWPDPVHAPGLAFVRDGRARRPQPDRLFGLRAPRMAAAVVARGRAGDERAWTWSVRVSDGEGRAIAERETTTVGGRFASFDPSFDVSEWPAGGYTMEIRAAQAGDAAPLVRRARFSVGWEPETWDLDAEELADEVHFLLEARDEETFASSLPGEQEQVLSEFWRKRDPTPGTAANEAHEGFRERVAYANRQWTRFGIGKGMFSDMGRVYIRYGPPSEITQQVMPAGDETLTRELERIMYEEQRAVGDLRQKGLGGDQRPFEVWSYEGDIPVPFDVEPGTVPRGSTRRRLMFLFVDEQGLGTYTLRYTTE